MKQVVFTSQFKRDYKKRQRETSIDDLLKNVLDQISESIPLPIKLRDHALQGGYFGSRECHLKPDLLLIYSATSTEVRLIPLGSHSELFD